MVGVKGIGIYKTFMHIDSGESPLNPRPQMVFWDQSEGKFGPIAMTTAYMAGVPEPANYGEYGNPICEGGSPPIQAPEGLANEFQSKKLNWLQRLFKSSEEDGAAWNTEQIIALALVVATLATFGILYYRKKRKK